MYLVYVDESGDTGTQTSHFALTGIVVHELVWLDYLNELINFRRRLRERYGLKLREEIHAKDFLRQPGDLARIPKFKRLEMLKIFLDQISSTEHFNVVNVLVSKEHKDGNYNVFENAWTTLIQRIENTIQYANFPAPRNVSERAIIFPDKTDVTRLTKLMRRLRRYNPVANKNNAGFRNLPITTTVEDPNFRDSADSFFIQAADVIAFFLYQKTNPSGYILKKSARNYFDVLDPVLCKVCAADDPQGIVRL